VGFRVLWTLAADLKFIHMLLVSLKGLENRRMQLG